jgi:hypothetical protein
MQVLYNEVITRVTVAIATRVNATTNGTTIDRTDPTGGTDSTTTALAVVFTGVITDGSHAVTVQDSDDGSSWAAASTDYIQGTQPTMTSTDSNKAFEIGYTGPKRYLRVSIVSSGSTTGGIFGAVVILGGAGRAPVQR